MRPSIPCPHCLIPDKSDIPARYFPVQSSSISTRHDRPNSYSPRPTSRISFSPNLIRRAVPGTHRHPTSRIVPLLSNSSDEPHRYHPNHAVRQVEPRPFQTGSTTPPTLARSSRATRPPSPLHFSPVPSFPTILANTLPADPHRIPSDYPGLTAACPTSHVTPSRARDWTSRDYSLPTSQSETDPSPSNRHVTSGPP